MSAMDDVTRVSRREFFARSAGASAVAAGVVGTTHSAAASTVQAPQVPASDHWFSNVPSGRSVVRASHGMVAASQPLASMVGLGIAWASIIALPYAMLANSLPARKMGVNMGIFNIFIVIPQLLAATVLSWLLDVTAHGDPVGALAIAAAGWILAGLAVMRVREGAAS